VSPAPSRKEDLNRYLKELHLPTVRRCFEEKARQAERETSGYEQYLLELVERECQERREHRVTKLLRASRLPLEKTMENFEVKRLPAKAARQVKALLDGGFLDRRENVLAFGNPGSGKTHLLSASEKEKREIVIVEFERLQHEKADEQAQAGDSARIGASALRWRKHPCVR